MYCYYNLKENFQARNMWEGITVDYFYVARMLNIVNIIQPQQKILIVEKITSCTTFLFSFPFSS